MYKHHIGEKNFTVRLSSRKKPREGKRTEMQPGLSDRNHTHLNPWTDRAGLVDRLPLNIEELRAILQMQPTLWFLEDKKKLATVIQNMKHRALRAIYRLIINQWGWIAWFFIAKYFFALFFIRSCLLEMVKKALWKDHRSYF